MTLPEVPVPAKRGGERQLQRDRLAAGGDPLDLVAIGDGQRRGGDGGGAGREIGAAGVRVAMGIGADRFDHDRRGAHFRRQRRPDEARRTIGAIARPVLRRVHRIADIDDLAADAVGRGIGEVAIALEHDERRGEAAGRCRTRIAERHQLQLLREGGEDLRRFDSAQPHGHLIFFDMDVLEAERLELRDRPNSRARFGIGRRQPLADLGRQPLDDVIGQRVGQRCIAQRGDLGIDGGGDGRGGPLREREAGQGGGRGEGEQGEGDARHIR